ncbi:hypothetical protein FB566_3248 [Stackebrandtia endophytica]|uniref:Cell wall protein n=1 Tax=Stackebrandtia endophytica TaxID=1496996 RepID=A0A543AYN3_9ACTN|nr:cell wall protein [Stackebrandtia endophytica]TQL77686.1 hypothetical protein FB566_3248 [Stackebrandtia endophytica]
MAKSFDRRRLLTGAALGAAGVVTGSAFGSFAPEAALAAEPTPGIDPGMPDPNFAEGLIRSISDDTISALGSDGTLWRVRVTSGTSVWKLKPTTFDNVAVGDGMYARGAVLDDGTIAADSVWANIVNLKAHVTSIGEQKLYLDHNDERVIAHVIPGTTAAVYNGTPAISDVSMVKVDSHVQVLGAWLPGTNEIEISTIYAAA